MKLPSMPVYVADLLIDTAQMTEAEFGVYMRLLFQQWANGGFDSKPMRLLLAAGPHAAEIWPKIRHKFIRGEDGLWRNPRCEAEREKVMKRINDRKSAGLEGARRRWGKNGKPNGKPNGKTMPSRSRSKSISKNKSGAAAPRVPRGTETAGKERPRDDLFEAVLAGCEIDWRAPMNPEERKRYNKAVSLIRQADGRPGDVPARIRRYRLKFSSAALTPMALAVHWTECGPGLRVKPPEKGQVDPRLEEAEFNRRALKIAPRGAQEDSEAFIKRVNLAVTASLRQRAEGDKF